MPRGPIRSRRKRGGCSERSKIVEKVTDLFKYFFDVFENDMILIILNREFGGIFWGAHLRSDKVLRASRRAVALLNIG
jgi:hypothetical protein